MKDLDFVNFMERDTRIIIDALSFTREKILEYYKGVVSKVDEKLKDPLWDEYKRIVIPIYDTIDFFNDHINRRFIRISEEYLDSLMQKASSSLIFYQKHLKEIQENMKVEAYSDLIKNIDRILASQVMKKSNKELYEKYSSLESDKNFEKKPEIFISYQTKDKKIAFKIKRLLVANSELDEEDVFVAHRDIKLSNKWRDDIIIHLEKCTHLIALCTEDYRCSAWGNQEVGYVMAKENISVIPLFWEGINREDFGFIEGFQSLPSYINEESLENAVNEIIKKVGLKK